MTKPLLGEFWNWTGLVTDGVNGMVAIFASHLMYKWCTKAKVVELESKAVGLKLKPDEPIPVLESDEPEYEFQQRSNTKGKRAADRPRKQTKTLDRATTSAAAVAASSASVASLASATGLDINLNQSLHPSVSHLPLDISASVRKSGRTTSRPTNYRNFLDEDEEDQMQKKRSNKQVRKLQVRDDDDNDNNYLAINDTEHDEEIISKKPKSTNGSQTKRKPKKQATEPLEDPITTLFLSDMQHVVILVKMYSLVRPRIRHGHATLFIIQEADFIRKAPLVPRKPFVKLPLVLRDFTAAGGEEEQIDVDIELELAEMNSNAAPPLEQDTTGEDPTGENGENDNTSLSNATQPTDRSTALCPSFATTSQLGNSTAELERTAKLRSQQARKNGSQNKRLMMAQYLYDPTSTAATTTVSGAASSFVSSVIQEASPVPSSTSSHPNQASSVPNTVPNTAGSSTSTPPTPPLSNFLLQRFGLSLNNAITPVGGTSNFNLASINTTLPAPAAPNPPQPVSNNTNPIAAPNDAIVIASTQANDIAVDAQARDIEANEDGEGDEGELPPRPDQIEFIPPLPRGSCNGYYCGGLVVLDEGRCIVDEVTMPTPRAADVPGNNVNRLQRQDQCRFCLYYYYSVHVFGVRGAHNRRPLPACVVYAIRQKYPNALGTPYKGFRLI